MATNFERAKKIIKKLFPKARKNIKDPAISVEQMVKRRLNQLSQGYGDRLLRQNRDPVDYSFVTTHIAYCYRTLSAHGDWLAKVMERAVDACEASMVRKTVKVAAIGGGPGSDILGVMKFALRHGLGDKKFRFAVLDREKAWSAARDALIETYNDEADVAAVHFPFDASAKGKWTRNWKFAEADLFTFSFFLSEVWSFNGDGSVSAFLQRLIDLAKPGAVFVYIDNGGERFAPLADAEFARDDIELIEVGADDRLLMSFDEQCEVLEKYREKFGQLPKLTGNVSWRIWRKSGG